MRKEPVKGQLYRHFKGNVYEILAVALHTEMDEFLVVYQNVNDRNRVYARPVDMFLSEVDHDKYPNVVEKYRFTLVEEDKCCSQAELSDKSTEYEGKKESERKAANNEENEKAGINPLLEALLDADSFEDKLDIYYKMRNTEDVTMLRNVAVSLDIETTKDDPYELYDEILGCLKMMTKYECNRLRRR